MPAIKLSEYQVKTLWHRYLKKRTIGCDFLSSTKKTLDETLQNNLVVKLDDGSKRRMKRGLVQIGLSREEVLEWVSNKRQMSVYKSAPFFVEPVNKLANHSNSREMYIMIRENELTDTIYVNEIGGITQDDPMDGAHQIHCLIHKDPSLENLEYDETFASLEYSRQLLRFIVALLNFFRKYHFTFLEINPLLCNGASFEPLDFAGLIDNCSFYLQSSEDRELLTMKYNADLCNTEIEQYIASLDEKTGGSLKFTLLNPQGNIWTLIAGGGASVVYTDAICNMGYAYELANYGEYSGNPPEELVYEYANAIFKKMKEVQREKTLFIGGGIANFTDIKKTFMGIVRAMKDNIDVFKNTVIYVRRGGPMYKEGLALFEELKREHGLKCYIYGPEVDITYIVEKGLRHSITESVSDICNKHKNVDMTQLYSIEPDINERINVFSFNKHDTFMVYSYQPVAIQRMLDFDYVCGKPKPSISCIIDPRKKKDSMESFLWGSDTILLPLYTNTDHALRENPRSHHIVNFASFRSAYESTCTLMNYPQIQSISVIAEGIPERNARHMLLQSRCTKTCILGPSTVGGIKPGYFRIGNTGGSIENIEMCRMNQTGGSVAFVTRSGGLLNELCNIVSQTCDGVYQGMSIGGDRHPNSSFLQFVRQYNMDPKVSMIIVLGEVGGIQELLLANAVRTGVITKPVIAWCMGTSANYFTQNVQFGHAGASAHEEFESASFKNAYMRHCGVHVPDNFEQMSNLIEMIFIQVKTTFTRPAPIPLVDSNYKPRMLPTSRSKIQMFSSISNEMKDELHYNNTPISQVADMNQSNNIGKTLGHLWLKETIPDWMARYFELILVITADHGAMVSGAHNTIVASRAGKDLVSSLCSGLLTIGDYFGGAINNAGRLFFDATTKRETPVAFVARMNRTKTMISGIGHKIKTKQNPDKRVSLLHDYVVAHFPNHETVDFGFGVEELTLQKRNNLILNVDGFIACSMIDCFRALKYTDTQINEIIENCLLNGFFVLGRTIGFIGHYYDQKRLKQGLYRVPSKDVKYIDE